MPEGGKESLQSKVSKHMNPSVEHLLGELLDYRNRIELLKERIGDDREKKKWGMHLTAPNTTGSITITGYTTIYCMA